MAAATDRPLTVFLSYSHDSPEHDERVLALADRLRRDGFDAALDQYEVSPPEGWPLWRERQVKGGDFVLMVCTPAYDRRLGGQEEAEANWGMRWEVRLIRNLLYDADAQDARFVPVLLTDGLPQHIPLPVRDTDFFRVETDGGYQALLRRLLGQAPAPRPPLGPRPRATDFFRPWNVPHARNPFFTGREDVLTQLRDALTAGRSAALTQAISGMGGIGKTQTAVEYAYRHQDEYQAVLWASALDETTLREGFVEIARLLGLPQAQEADQGLAVQAVQVWLEREEGWLLILDNADEPKAIKPFLPPQKKGHVLLTTRAAALGAVAQKVEIRKLSEGDGALLLLRRAKLVEENGTLDAANAVDKEAAQALSRTVDGLPLALDQAGAFIEETQGSPARYLELYQTEAAALLAEYGDPDDRDHASVRVTFSLAFAKVAASPAAGELIRCCAFLAPDAIPEEIFTGGDAALNAGPGPFGVTGFAWEKLVGAACRYSLLSRDAGTLSLHRLVQTVIRQELDDITRRAYVMCVVRAVSRTFPNPEVSNWPLCERLLPHARQCAVYITDYSLEFAEAVRLLNKVSNYLHERGQYTEAEPLYRQALAIRENSLEPTHPDTAISLNNLASLYESQGRYEEALPLFHRTLAIWEDALGPNHRNTATSLRNLAVLYESQGRYAEALPLHQRALAIREEALGPEHPETAQSLNSLASLYKSQGRYEEALPLYQRALAVREKALGPEHPETAQSLNSLAGFFNSHRRYAEALPLYQRALAIREKVLGPEHRDVATSLDNLANLYRSQGRYTEALPLFLRALAIREKALGPEHPATAMSLNNLAGLYGSQGQYKAVEPLLNRALAICEQSSGPYHPNTATILDNLAELYRIQGQYTEAEPLLKRALAICERTLGLEHPTTTELRGNHTRLLAKINPRTNNSWDSFRALFRRR